MSSEAWICLQRSKIMQKIVHGPPPPTPSCPIDPLDGDTTTVLFFAQAQWLCGRALIFISPLDLYFFVFAQLSSGCD